MKIYLAGYGKGGGEISDELYFSYLQTLNIRKLFSFFRDKNSMKVYFAGGENKSWLKAINEAGGNKSLYSYYYLEKGGSDFIDISAVKQNDIFLDSGGFSAWSKGVDVKIDDYIEFIKRNKNNITTYANLDVIGDAEKTNENQLYMESKGLNPIPTFHYGTNYDILKEMIKKYKYIALGGLVPISRNSKKMIKHLDNCFKIIKDKVKVHGFGVTNMLLLKRYPFYSVDSTSWLGGSMRAEAYEFDNGKMKTHRTTKKNKITRISAKYKDFDNKKWFDRVVNNAIEWQKAEKYLTKLWEKRGIVWNE